MTLGVIIIAHNEEKNIARCLKSVINQSEKADRIWLIAHNCSDKTVSIVHEYPGVEVVEYEGPAGIVPARSKAFEVATTDLVASIDGDSWADKDWLKGLRSAIGKKSVSGAGGAVIFCDSLVAKLFSINFFYIQRLLRPKIKFYFWGSNYICRREDFNKVGGLSGLLELKEKIGLHYLAEDLYLALKLKSLGRVVFAPNAKVYSRTSINDDWKVRGAYQHQDKLKLFKYFGITK